MLNLVNEFTAVLDACVLAPMPVCDTLLRLAEEPSFFIPKWSAHILLEVRSTLSKFGYSDPQVERRILAMTTAFEDAAVSGYEKLIPAMTNDEGDRHVLAAAVRCNADAIVTSNKRDFPDDSVRPYGILVLSCDDFFVHQFDLDTAAVCEKVERQASARKEEISSLVQRLSVHTPGFANKLRFQFDIGVVAV
jgi:predicted nucleic acid-binding protein